MFSLSRHLRSVAVACAASLAAIFVMACGQEQGEVLSPSLDFEGDGGNSPVVEQTEDLLPLYGTVAGKATLKRAVDGLSVRIKASGDDIKEGDAFTFWAVAWNNPDACNSTPCSIPGDIRTETGFTILNFGGGYDMDGDAVLEMDEGGGELARFSTETMVLVPGPDAPPGLNKGIKNPYQAEVHVILRNHGMKASDTKDDDGDGKSNLEEQTSEVRAFCNLGKKPGDDREDDDSTNPETGPDNCEDQGWAIFLSAEAPGQSN